MSSMSSRGETRQQSSFNSSFQACRDAEHASFLNPTYGVNISAARSSTFQLISHWIFSTQNLSTIVIYTASSPSDYILFHGSCTACTYPLFVTKLSVVIARRSQSAAEKFERLLPTISCQVDPDQLIQTLQDRPALSHKHHIHTRNAISSITPYSSRYSSQQEISKFKIPQEGAPADAVHQMLKDELDLDGRPNLNLARSSIAQLFGMIEAQCSSFVVLSAHIWNGKLKL